MTAKNTLWPRWLCKREDPQDPTSKILEEKLFQRAEDVPEGEGWDVITPPAPPPETAAELVRKADARAAEAEAVSAKLAACVAELEGQLAKKSGKKGEAHADPA